jgi:NADPH:quinone reductase-like Zn-dependent oxidoreductase
MKAAVRDRYGPPEIVRVEEIERRPPGEGEVLVRVHASSVNRADLDYLKPRPSFARLFTGIRAPKHRRIGLDVAGVVETVGAGVTTLAPGHRVFADLSAYGDEGAFAEYVRAPARAFATVPADMPFEDAATMPHSAILAIQGLRLRNGRTPRPGDKVLIDGASGNVGPFAVQIAKWMGAEVTGVTRTEKLDFVRSLGADKVLDYTKVDYTRESERYDWILDTDSHHSILRVRRALRRNGVYVTLGGTTGPIVASLVLGPLISLFSDRWSGLLLWWKPFDPADVARLLELHAAGVIKPAIDQRFPLERVVEALRWLEDGRQRGKVVVTTGAPGETAAR